MNVFISKALLLLFLMFACSVSGQQLPDRARSAERDYENKEYALAAKLYASLIESGETPFYVKRIAECYRQTKKYELAEKWYEREMEIQPTSSIERYYYADMLHQNGKYREAQHQLELFLPLTQKEKNLKTQGIGSLNSMSRILRLNTGFTLVNARNLNSVYSDFGAAISNDKLIFVSNRPLSKSELKANPEYRNTYGWTNQPFWKLFETHFEALGNTVQPFLMSPVINSPFNNGPAVFNKSGNILWFSKAEELQSTGKIVFLSKSKFIGHNGIYFTERVNNTWSPPHAFPYNNLKSYSISHPALSPDGKLLYFASDMPGGKGGVDLYYVEILSGNTFSKPVNLGDSINTALDEEFPTIGPDSSLYFSTNGRQGLGGLDIYRSKGSDSHWKTPENLGSPVNSTRDDFSLIFRPGGNPYRGYLSSNREGGMGDDDIYSFDYVPIVKIRDSVKTVQIKSRKTQLARDSIKVFFKLKSLDNLQGKTLSIPNIYYKTKRADPESPAFPVLDKLVRLLQLFPKMEIQIRSHTDAVGSGIANLKLSQDRANWVKTYFVLHGISIQRLSSKGFGKTQMLVKCGIKKPCTAKQNKINRRTELQILKQ